MKSNSIVIGIATLAGVLVAGSAVNAGTTYMPTEGFPYNNTPLSNYTVSDGIVYFSGGLAWTVPVPMPTSTGVVTRTLSANYGNLSAAQAWSFNVDGSVYSGVSFTPSNTASISVPVNGTVFFKAIATSSPTLKALVRRVSSDT